MPAIPSTLRIVVWLSLAVLTAATYALVRHDRPPKVYSVPRFETEQPLVTRSSFGGIRIGEPIDDALRTAGQSHYPESEVYSVLRLDHEQDLVAGFTSGAIRYGEESGRVRTVELDFSTGLRTQYGDRLGTSLETVRTHYPEAVEVAPSSCFLGPGGTNLVTWARPRGHLLDFWFVQNRLAGAMLTTWPRLTELCRFEHEHDPQRVAPVPSDPTLPLRPAPA